MSNQEESLIGGVVTGVTGVADDAISAVTGGVGGVISGVTGGIGGAISSVSGGIGNAIGGPIGSVIGGVGGGVGSVIGAVGGGVGGLIGGVGGLAGDIVGGVGGAIGGGIDSLIDGPSVPDLPGVDSIPLPGSGGSKDPCNRADYIANKLGSMPMIGDFSLKDMGVNLSNLAMPKLPEIKIPSFKMPSLKDIGNKISGGIGDLVGDLKSGISGALDELSPGNLMAKAKGALGKAGRLALADAIEDGITGMLGPVKAGLGNQLKRSFKQNMLMLGVSEIANVISGEPNILDPCAGRGKDKLKGLVSDQISAGASGKAIADIGSSLSEAINPDLMSTKQLAAMQVPVLGDPSLPGALDKFNVQKQKNDAIVSEKTDEAIVAVAKKTAKKAVAEEAAAEEPVIEFEEQFPPPKPPVLEYHFIESMLIGPKPGWLGESDSKENSDIIDMLKKDIADNWIGDRDKDSVVYNRNTPQEILIQSRDDILSRKDVDKIWRDYIGVDAEGKITPTRHYMIWCSAYAHEFTWSPFGHARVNAIVQMTIFRTCDDCGTPWSKNHDFTNANVMRRAQGDSREEAFMEVITSSVDKMFQDTFTPAFGWQKKR